MLGGNILNKDDAKILLRKRLGIKRVKGWILEILHKNRYIKEYVNQEDMEDLIQQYQLINNTYAGRESYEESDQKDVGDETTLATPMQPDDGRMSVVAEFIAFEAACHPEVVSFREHYLKNELLDLSDVERWISVQRTIEGTYQGILKYCDSNNAVHEVEIGNEGVLWTLRHITRGLCREYIWWSEPQVVTFILSGKTPDLPAARIKLFTSPDKYSQKITLELNPLLSESDVTSLYRMARSYFVSSGRKCMRKRRFSDYHLALALNYVERKKCGKSWDTLREEWVKLHPEDGDRFLSSRRFCQEVSKAARRVRGL